MATRKNILDKDKNIIGIEVTTDSKKFVIPVADVRVNRERAESIIKAQNSSKFLKPSYSWKGYSYNTSMKK